MTSTSGAADTSRSASIIAFAANGPCTYVSATTTRAAGKRAVIVVNTSRFAAASFPVTSPIRRGMQRQRPLALEHALGGELPLQTFERGEMVAEPEALDRERAHTEVASRFEQLRPSEHVHALAVDEIEPERVEARARDRDAEARAVARILEREEDRLPASVASQFGDLAFDPDRREAARASPRRHG